MGFLDKLKELLMGQQAQAPSGQGIDPNRPWDSPGLQEMARMKGQGGASGGMHMMPGGQMMPDAEMGPQSIADDPMALAVKLMKQREMAAAALPERSWNR